MHDVVITEFCFWTPRIIMHMCCDSIMTATPSARVFSKMVSAIHVHDARNLRQADDHVSGQIRNVAFANERQQVMFAQ